MSRVLIWIATFFGVGHIVFIPGSWASLITTGTLYIVHPYFTILNLGVASAIIFIAGVFAASKAERHYQKKDPRECVIDEVAGQMVALITIPHNIWYYMASFFLFRILDIIKPFPAKQCEKIPAGAGVMLDDIISGVYTLAILHLLIRIF